MRDMQDEIRGYLEKDAAMFPWAGRKAVAAGKGLWNMAFGGQTQGGQWSPLHALWRMGRPQKTFSEGPFKGMRMFDRTTGAPVFEDKRNIFRYLKQEFQGGHPMKSDIYALQAAKRAPVSQEALEQGIASGRYATPGSKNWMGGTVKHPTGVNLGEYLNAGTIPSRDLQVMNDINNIGFIRSMMKHKDTATRYNIAKAGLRWGAGHALHKGFIVGLPGYEMYDAVANREGMYPDKGMAANLGSSIGSGLGWLGGLPLGWVGAPMLAHGLGELGAAAGGLVDRAMGNKPLTPRTSGIPGSQDIARIPHQVVTQGPQAAVNTVDPRVPMHQVHQTYRGQ